MPAFIVFERGFCQKKNTLLPFNAYSGRLVQHLCRRCCKRGGEPQLQLRQPPSVTLPSNQRRIGTSLSSRSLKGHDVLLNMCLAVGFSDGFRWTLFFSAFASNVAVGVRACTSLRAYTRWYTSAVQQQCAYFKGVDGFH